MVWTGGQTAIMVEHGNYGVKCQAMSSEQKSPGPVPGLNRLDLLRKLKMQDLCGAGNRLKYYNFQDILIWRRIFPDKLILQAFEWNVPGHEHANISIIANQFDTGKENCDPLAQFEYMFDDDDKDTTGGLAFGWKKSRLESKEKAREAVKWLQANYPLQTYVVPSHPDKSGDYSISDFRDFNNAAPDVFFGFDGMPGHQKNSIRGSYDLDEAPFAVEMSNKKGATFGGAGIFASKIGGVWDALLSEGRKWWISASSDYHSDDDFYPGEYQKTYTYVTEKMILRH